MNLWYRLVPATALLAGLIACGAADGDDYALVPPPVPETWAAALGEPAWRFEWVDANGVVRQADSYGPAGINAGVRQSATTPLSAFPFWPDKGIAPGVFREAGALFPFDVRGGEIRLSWEGGVDAHFYKLISDEASGKRLPQNFNWPRFRDLRNSDKLDADTRADPWIADWPFAAQKAVDAGFSANRIKPQKRTYATVTVPADGPWISVSPFAAALLWENGDTESVPVCGATAVFFCPAGLLRAGNGVWVFRPFPER